MDGPLGLDRPGSHSIDSQAFADIHNIYIHRNSLPTKGGSDLVWYSIDRDIFKTESIFLQKKNQNKC